MLTPLDGIVLFLIAVATIGIPLSIIASNLVKLYESSERRNELCNESNNMIAAQHQMAEAAADQLLRDQREHFAKVREQLKDYE